MPPTSSDRVCLSPLLRSHFQIRAQKQRQLRNVEREKKANDHFARKKVRTGKKIEKTFF